MVTTPVGKDLKTYYNSATHALPTWVAVPRVINETVSFDKDLAEQKNRESEFKRNLGAHKGIGGSFGYHEKSNEADTVFDKIWDSYLNDTVVEFAFMDGDIATSGNKGFRVGLIVTKLERKRELSDGTEWGVEWSLTEFVESSALVEPDRYTVP